VDPSRSEAGKKIGSAGGEEGRKKRGLFFPGKNIAENINCSTNI
jgi:hypothetical protein